MDDHEERDERKRARIWAEERLNAKNEGSYQTNKKAADVLWWGALVVVVFGCGVLLLSLYGVLLKLLNGS